MTNYREILRLHGERYSMRALVKRPSRSRDAVGRCIERANKKGVKLSLAEEVTNEDLWNLPSYHLFVQP